MGGDTEKGQPEARLFYLTGTYPAASHTFILREVAALRALGLAVETGSVRQPRAADLIGPEEAVAARETFYLLRAARNPFRLLSDHVASLVRAPGRYAGALWLALRTGRPGLRGALRQLFYFAEAGVLGRHLLRTGIGQIHSHFADSSTNLAMIAARMTGLPFSFTLHGPAELFDPAGWHLGTKVAEARFTICISQFARAQAMLYADRADWARLHVVHCGVDPARYAPAPSRGAGPFTLLFVGRLTAIKGLFVLLDALGRLPRGTARLRIVGDGPDRAALEAEVARRGLDATFNGFASQAEVAEALAEADAFVLPSFAEGVPVVLMEAMAARLPVIATQVGGVAELVEDGQSGHMVPPGDAAALSGAIAALSALSMAERQAMGDAGRVRVEAAFDQATEARKLARLFAGDAP